jgi:uncharacterized membrane protein
MKLRSTYLWFLAFVLVALAAVYQRMTGPTYPVHGSARIGANDIHFSLPRSYGGDGGAEVRLTVPDPKIAGIIEFSRFRSSDPLTRHDLRRQGDDLVALIPHQPPAGKVAYRIYLYGGADPNWLTAEPVVMRFKGDVPAYIMVPHIILMFLAMLFSTRAGIEALLKRPETYKLAVWTSVSLAIGGLILGPIVQKLAFGAFWTGWPIGKDLTDNKTVGAFLVWLVALWRLRKRPNAIGWAIAASAVLFLVYMIPHSLLGSELDYRATSGGQ